MTDEPAQVTANEPDPSRDRARIAPTGTHRSADLLPGLYLLGFLALAGAMYYLWANPPDGNAAAQTNSRLDAVQAEVASLRQQLTALQSKPQGPEPAAQTDFVRLQQQVSDLAAKPAPAPVSLGPIESRLGALEGRKAATPEQVAQLTTEVTTLATQVGDAQKLGQRLDVLEKRPVFDPSALQTEQKQQADKEAALAQRVDATDGRLATVQKDTVAKTDALGSQIAQARKEIGDRLDAADAQGKQNAEQVKALGQKLVVATRLQGAAAALAAGNKLGDIPGAPAALARFANQAPPTEAALRGSFDDYAAKAQQASQPGTDDKQNFAERMWSRAQQTVTVRQGDRVLVGDPITGVLAHARELLDNGDIGGAVKTLDGLSGAPAQAIKPWTDQARSLMDARAALASMAAG